MGRMRYDYGHGEGILEQIYFLDIIMLSLINLAFEKNMKLCKRTSMQKGRKSEKKSHLLNVNIIC